ncbi:MAG: glycosyltransferase family 1 protein [Myxococcota bacterium]
MTSSQPRIVINTLSARTGGGLTYARNLLMHLDLEYRADVFVLVAPQRRHLLPDGPYTFIDCAWAGQNVLQRTLWEAFGLPRLLRELGADVYYVLAGTLAAKPPAGCKSVVAFRNLLPFDPKNRKRYPHGYTRYRLWLIGLAQPRSFAQADLVIFISEYGRKVVEAVVTEPAGRAVVIPHGVGEVFKGDVVAGDWNTRWPGGYVLYVSILDVYKSQLEVVEAWASIRGARETREKLILAGPEYPPYARRVKRKIAELGLEDEVVLLGPVAHDDLPGLYRSSKVTVFASQCENCPNILLEAMAGGRPVLCSSDPPMPEFGVDAVVYFDPTDSAELADRLIEMLDDPERQKDYGDRAKRRSADFRVDAAMRRTWESMLELANGDWSKSGD